MSDGDPSQPEVSFEEVVYGLKIVGFGEIIICRFVTGGTKICQMCVH